ncbi:sortase [Streptomyces sp. NPDC093589]|uniref:sortase n=1 Tax=Streptomyces sp. NPDC093589 TaxID=3366043 RepID=UPI0038104AF4
MPENPPAADAAKSTSSSEAGQTSRTRRNILIGAAVAAAVAIGLTGVRWSNGPQPAVAETKTAAAKQPSTSAQDSLETSRPSARKAPDHTDKATDQASKTLHGWSKHNPAGDSKHAVSGTPDIGVGGHINEVLRIPALGTSWAQPVYEGVGVKQLRAGVGHFDGSADPGELGNFALAGHRSGVTNPPFRDIDRVKPGSAIKVTTANRTTYIYTVARVRIVPPTDVDVLLPVPDKPNAVPTTAKLTLVTCWPATGHTKRVIVEANLTSARGGAK